jgi:hypothetical protein
VAIDAQFLSGAQETSFGVAGLPERVGQTVLVTRTGFLTEVRLDLGCRVESDERTGIHVNVEHLSAGAAPSGTGEGEARVYNAQVTTGVRYDRQLKAYRLLDVLRVVAGDRLAIAVSVPRPTDACMLRGSSSDAYAGGQAFQVTGGTVSIVSTRDYAFQTLVSATPSEL